MATLEEAQDPFARVALLVHMALRSAPLRLCTRSTHLQWGGFTWLGSGQLGSVGALTDGGGEVAGLTFSLSGVPQDDVQLARDEPVRWQRVYVYLARLADEDDSVISCERYFSGVLDAMFITDDTESATVSVTAEHLGQTLRRPNVWLYTHNDQQILSTRNAPFQADDSLRNMSAQAVADLVWPERTWFMK